MATAATGMRAYVIVWAGQFISLVGSNMTAFGMEVWVFQKTGSVALLGLILALSVLPFALVSPFTGALVVTGLVGSRIALAGPGSAARRLAITTEAVCVVAIVPVLTLGTGLLALAAG